MVDSNIFWEEWGSSTSTGKNNGGDNGNTGGDSGNTGGDSGNVDDNPLG